MRHPFPEQRIVRGAIDATISHQFTDADGDADDPEGTVTVAVTRSDGTAVTVGAVSGTGTAARTVSVGVAETATIDRLTAVWSLDGTAIATDEIEVVGGTVGSIAAIKVSEASLSGDADAALKQARKAAEDRFMSTQNRSPFVRLVVERFDGTGLYTLHGATLPDLQSVVWARVYTNATTYTELTAAELAAIDVPDVYSRFERTDGKLWPCGRRNVEIAYTAGLTALPADLRRALHAAVRYEVSKDSTAVPQRSESFQSFDGVTIGLARPGRGRAYGVDDIDDVFMKYADPRPMVA